VEPLDPTTAGKLKRFKRVEVNALHLTDSECALAAAKF